MQGKHFGLMVEKHLNMSNLKKLENKQDFFFFFKYI